MKMFSAFALFLSTTAVASPCEQYCDSKADGFLAACEVADHDPATCADAWMPVRDECFASQCALDPQIPSDLQPLAEGLIPELLGAEYQIVSSVPHFYDSHSGEPGSMVFTLASTADDSPAFLEVGTSLVNPPVICYGTGPTAADALTERAIEALTEAYGEASYTLTKRFLSAAHPILQFNDGGRDLFYAVATADVSDVFVLEADPDAEDAMAIRRESHKRLWANAL